MQNYRINRSILPEHYGVQSWVYFYWCYQRDQYRNRRREVGYRFETFETYIYNGLWPWEEFVIPPPNFREGRLQQYKP